MRRRTITDQERAEIAMAALKEKESVSEICSRYSISDVTYYRIKEQAIAALPEAMRKTKDSFSAREIHLDKENRELKELVADQAVAIQILKKTRGGSA